MKNKMLDGIARLQIAVLGVPAAARNATGSKWPKFTPLPNDGTF